MAWGGCAGPRHEACGPGSGCSRGRSRRRLGRLLRGRRRGGLGLEQLAEDPQVVAQVARREEALAHVLLAAAPERLAQRGVEQDVERAFRAGLHVTDEIPGDAVLALQRDPPNVPADERPPLPEGLADGEPEALA